MKVTTNAYSGAERLNSIADVLAELLADERPAYELCGLSRAQALVALRALGAAEALQAAMDEGRSHDAEVKHGPTRSLLCGCARDGSHFCEEHAPRKAGA